jgi:hypothetical protein
VVKFFGPLQGSIDLFIRDQWLRCAGHWIPSSAPAALVPTMIKGIESRMKTLILIGLFLILPCSCFAQSPKPTLNDLSWLAGCWEANLKGREVTEQWMKPGGGIMLGMARTVSKGKAAEFEFTQIREQDDAIYYVAKPSGQAEASFKLIKLQNKEAVFENPQHDFPQRVIYRLQSDGSLFARVEAAVKGQLRGIDYPYKRAKCE